MAYVCGGTTYLTTLDDSSPCSPFSFWDPLNCIPVSPPGVCSNVYVFTNWFSLGAHNDCCDPLGLSPSYGQGIWFFGTYEDPGSQIGGNLCTCSGTPCTAWGPDPYCNMDPALLAGSNLILYSSPVGCGPTCAAIFWMGTGTATVWYFRYYELVCWSLTYKLTNGETKVKRGPGRYPSKIVLPDDDIELDSTILVEDGILIPRDKYDLKIRPS